MDQPKRLYRSRDQRVIAGVCGGMAKYFNIDTVIMRVIWLLLLLTAGGGLIAYLVCWFIIPNEPLIPSADKPQADDATSGSSHMN